jgi:hypothetical protein
MFFSPDGARLINPHPMNDRKQRSVIKEYKARLLSEGLVEDARGAAWFVLRPEEGGPGSSSSTDGNATDRRTAKYWAISYGTLLGAYLPYRIWAWKVFI